MWWVNKARNKGATNEGILAMARLQVRVEQLLDEGLYEAAVDLLRRVDALEATKEEQDV